MNGFEIGKEADIGDFNNEVVIVVNLEHWNGEISTENITPERSLFWLTGGDKEWRTMEYYNTPWCDCYLDFQTEFG
jgi:hypothetical protein